MTLQELEPATTVERALAYFDTLQPVTVEQMIGSWRGNGLVTGHPFDGHSRGWAGGASSSSTPKRCTHW